MSFSSLCTRQHLNISCKSHIRAPQAPKQHRRPGNSLKKLQDTFRNARLGRSRPQSAACCAQSTPSTHTTFAGTIIRTSVCHRSMSSLQKRPFGHISSCGSRRSPKCQATQSGGNSSPDAGSPAQKAQNSQSDTSSGLIQSTTSDSSTAAAVSSAQNSSNSGREPETPAPLEGVAKETLIRSAADRLRQLKSVKSDGVSDYRPTEQLSLARDRYLSTYLPYEWQAKIRARLERIPGAQFSYTISVVSIVGASLLSGLIAYEIWIPAHDVVLFLFDAASPESQSMQQLTFEAQYLGTISFVTATLLGNTFGWTFSKQQMMVAQLSEEVFALELLLQELFIEIPEPYLRWRVIQYIEIYIEEEMNTTATDSPFRANGAIAGILEALLRLKCDNEKNIGKLVESVEMLARANSQRYGTSASLLPTIHWVLLTGLSCLVLVSFILFDSDFEVSVGENRNIFAVVAAVLTTILLVLKDLSDPVNGVYSLSDTLDDRLSYVKWQMKNILNDPVSKVSVLSKAEELDGEESTSDADEQGSNKSEKQS